MSTTPQEALKQAIKSVGTAGELARRLGITAQAISQWDQVPPLQVLKVERESKVPRHELRPDLYPAEEHQPTQSEAAHA